MTEVAGSVVHEVLGRRALDVDQPIIDYIINVLADEDFDFGVDGEGAFEAIGELLVGAGCVDDLFECRSVSFFFSSTFSLLFLLMRSCWKSRIYDLVRLFSSSD